MKTPPDRLPDIAADPRAADLVARALAEDLGRGDVTTRALVGARARAGAVIVARRPCVVAGAGVARAVFAALDPAAECEVCVPDGRRAGRGEIVLRVAGRARAILAAERTALNFLQRLCGIATLTAAFVDRTKRFGVAVLDTRKTTPTLRLLEKYAVRCGGGRNHRAGLFDAVLIKDNHRAFYRGRRGGLAAAVRAARRRYPRLKLEIEVETAAELDDALAGRPDWVLLDNQPPRRLAALARRVRGRAKIEASGGITLRNAAAVAAAGVDAISLGCLTHSAPAADLSLEFIDVLPE